MANNNSSSSKSSSSSRSSSSRSSSKSSQAKRSTTAKFYKGFRGAGGKRVTSAGVTESDGTKTQVHFATGGSGGKRRRTKVTSPQALDSKVIILNDTPKVKAIDFRDPKSVAKLRGEVSRQQPTGTQSIDYRQAESVAKLGGKRSVLIPKDVKQEITPIIVNGKVVGVRDNISKRSYKGNVQEVREFYARVKAKPRETVRQLRQSAKLGKVSKQKARVERLEAKEKHFMQRQEAVFDNIRKTLRLPQSKNVNLFTDGIKAFSVELGKDLLNAPVDLTQSFLTIGAKIPRIVTVGFGGTGAGKIPTTVEAPAVIKEIERSLKEDTAPFFKEVVSQFNPVTSTGASNIIQLVVLNKLLKTKSKSKAKTSTTPTSKGISVVRTGKINVGTKAVKFVEKAILPKSKFKTIVKRSLQVRRIGGKDVYVSVPSKIQVRIPTKSLKTKIISFPGKMKIKVSNLSRQFRIQFKKARQKLKEQRLEVVTDRKGMKTRVGKKTVTSSRIQKQKFKTIKVRKLRTIIDEFGNVRRISVSVNKRVRVRPPKKKTFVKPKPKAKAKPSFKKKKRKPRPKLSKAEKDAIASRKLTARLKKKTQPKASRGKIGEAGVSTLNGKRVYNLNGKRFFSRKKWLREVKKQAKKENLKFSGKKIQKIFKSRDRIYKLQKIFKSIGKKKYTKKAIRKRFRKRTVKQIKAEAKRKAAKTQKKKKLPKAFRGKGAGVTTLNGKRTWIINGKKFFSRKKWLREVKIQTVKERLKYTGTGARRLVFRSRDKLTKLQKIFKSKAKPKTKKGIRKAKRQKIKKTEGKSKPMHKIALPSRDVLNRLHRKYGIKITDSKGHPISPDKIVSGEKAKLIKIKKAVSKSKPKSKTGRATGGQRQQLVLLQKKVKVGKARVKTKQTALLKTKKSLIKKNKKLLKTKTKKSPGDIKKRQNLKRVMDNIKRAALLLGLFVKDYQKTENALKSFQPTIQKPVQKPATKTKEILKPDQKPATKQDIKLASVVAPALTVITTTVLINKFFTGTRQTSKRGAKGTPGSAGKGGFRPFRTGKQNRQFKFISDLQSQFFGIKATKEEAAKLTRRGRVFSGLEIRKLIGK